MPRGKRRQSLQSVVTTDEDRTLTLSTMLAALREHANELKAQMEAFRNESRTEMQSISRETNETMLRTVEELEKKFESALRQLQMSHKTVDSNYVESDHALTENLNSNVVRNENSNVIHENTTAKPTYATTTANNSTPVTTPPKESSNSSGGQN